MIYLLDTDMLIYMVRGLKAHGRQRGQRQRAVQLVQRCRAAQTTGHELGLSALTVAELEFGAHRSGNYGAEIAAVRKVLSPFEAYDFDAVACAANYGRIRHELEKNGTMIGSMDLLIAAHAVSLDAILITNNVAHFSRVSGLRVENWLSA
jgi:tRNA(fMet)-specific endonuclease VapC